MSMKDIAVLKEMNVLYVDDNKEAREKLSTILHYFFKNVFTASNGLEAYDTYKSHQCHLLLVDYDMPDMDGNSFLKLVREENRHIPAAIISSYEEKEKLKNAIKLQLVDYLTKPYSLEELKKLLQTSVEWMRKHNLLEIELGEGVQYIYHAKKLTNEGNEVQLTGYEAQILEHLLQNGSKVVTYDQLLDLTLDQNSKKSLITTVYKLKKKLPAKIINNIKDVGYVLTLP